MSGSATIVGGALVNVSALNPSEQAAAQAALTAIGQGFTTGFVLTDPGAPPIRGALDIYNLAPARDGETFRLQDHAEGIVLVGTRSAEIVGRGTREVLIGNAGNDVINAAGGSGTVIAGDGRNVITTGNGAGMLDIITGNGSDAVTLSSGEDTLTVGRSAEVTSLTDATVFGGTGNLVFVDQGSTHSKDLVVAGSGSATLTAGRGEATFVGGSARTVMLSGTGNDTFAGGSGHDVMTDTGRGHTVFQFDTALGGGSHLVFGFDAARDSIHLQGYTVSQFLGAVTVHGANSFVKLSDGTTIEFVGYNHLNASNFR